MAKLVLSDLGTVSSIAAGFDHTCAVKTDGTTHCWGSDSSDSAPTTSPNPSRVPLDLGIISTIEGGVIGTLLSVQVIVIPVASKIMEKYNVGVTIFMDKAQSQQSFSNHI